MDNLDLELRVHAIMGLLGSVDYMKRVSTGIVDISMVVHGEPGLNSAVDYLNQVTWALGKAITEIQDAINTRRMALCEEITQKQKESNDNHAQS